MKTKPIALVISIAGALSFGGFAVGCGDDDGDSTTAAAPTTTTTGAEAGGQTLEVRMGEFYYKPSDATASAGSVAIDAPNEGKQPHELVLAKTDDDPADLPTAADGTVDEESLDVPGEIPEVEAGASGTGSFELEAGKYVMFCNLPGHYKSGMYGSLTVE